MPKRPGVPEGGLAPLTRTPRARAAYAFGGCTTARQLLPALANGRARQAGRRRHQCIASVADGPRLGGRPHPATPFVQHRCHRGILRDHGGLQLDVSLHPMSRPEAS